MDLLLAIPSQPASSLAHQITSTSTTHLSSSAGSSHNTQQQSNSSAIINALSRAALLCACEHSTAITSHHSSMEEVDVDELGFSPDDVNSLIKESVDAVLAGQQYSEVKVGQWTSACLEGCMQRLSALERPYKYVVTCIIMQKTGAGLHTAASCYWDSSTDGSRTVRWENKTMWCITTVFGLAL